MSVKKNKVFEAYQQVGNFASLYDGMMTNSSILGRFAIHYLWQMSDENYREFIEQAFIGIPKNFSGRLLEIPVGTGVLSLPVYKNLTEAEIFAVDYSDNMILAAHSNAQKLNLNGVNFLQANVENLPFSSESFDLILSVNGFHAFPDKHAAYEETFRVLKSNGTFCGCMYVKGLNRLTDFFVRNFCERFGYFTPPYETLDSLQSTLNKLYRQVKISHVNSFAGFVCTK